jgi:hypothetical protein
MTIIIDRNIQNIINNDIFKYITIKNVINYECENFSKWIINNNEDSIIKDDVQYYLIIDMPFNEAFAHWVYESAVYLPLFINLKKEHPNIKLHFKTMKDYKKLFCKYFNIFEDDIALHLKENNVCIFPLPISCLNNIELTIDYKLLVNNLISNLNIIKENNKQYNILLSPRGKKENLVSNDRLCDVDDVINNISNNSNNYILYTDDIDNLNEQIQIFSNSKNVIVVDGSAYLVNGIFCTNSNIIVLGNVTLDQMAIYKKIQYIHELVLNTNTVTHLPYMNGNYNNSKYYFKDIKIYLK